MNTLSYLFLVSISISRFKLDLNLFLDFRKGDTVVPYHRNVSSFSGERTSLQIMFATGEAKIAAF